MARQVLEGTWEEIASHSEELRGYKKLRLFVDTDFTEENHEGRRRDRPHGG